MGVGCLSAVITRFLLSTTAKRSAFARGGCESAPPWYVGTSRIQPGLRHPIFGDLSDFFPVVRVCETVLPLLPVADALPPP